MGDSNPDDDALDDLEIGNHLIPTLMYTFLLGYADVCCADYTFAHCRAVVSNAHRENG